VRAAIRSAPAAFFLKKAGEPKFRELEPDGGLALPDRRSSNRSMKPRDDRADFP
jgi:hypothetical protein